MPNIRQESTRAVAYNSFFELGSLWSSCDTYLAVCFLCIQGQDNCSTFDETRDDIGAKVFEYVMIEECCCLMRVSKMVSSMSKRSLSRRRCAIMQKPYSLEAFSRIASVCPRVFSFADFNARRVLVPFSLERSECFGSPALPLQTLLRFDCVGWLGAIQISICSEDWNEFPEVLPTSEALCRLEHLTIQCDKFLPSMTTYFSKWQMLQTLHVRMFLTSDSSPFPENGTLTGLPGNLTFSVHIRDLPTLTPRSRRILTRIAQNVPLTTTRIFIIRTYSSDRVKWWHSLAPTIHFLHGVLRDRFCSTARSFGEDTTFLLKSKDTHE